MLDKVVTMSGACTSSSTSGIVEMEGFQRTFSNIYNVTSDNSSLLNSSSSELCCTIGGRRSNFITVSMLHILLFLMYVH